jgi:hypothetical protein
VAGVFDIHFPIKRLISAAWVSLGHKRNSTFPLISSGNWFAFLTMPTKIFESLLKSAAQGNNS